MLNTNVYYLSCGLQIEIKRENENYGYDFELLNEKV